MRALGVTTLQRSRLAPELPTVAETVPGYESESLICFFAPAKTPPAIIARLNSEINQVMKTTDQKRLNEAGVEAAGTTPEELAALYQIRNGTHEQADQERRIFSL